MLLILRILTILINILTMFLKVIIFVSLAVGGVFLAMASMVPTTRK
jgi:hypothetical protein